MEEPIKLTKWHYFEAMDRAHVANDHFFEYVETHPAVQQNENLKKEAENVTAVMYKFYCLTSRYLDKGDTI